METKPKKVEALLAKLAGIAYPLAVVAWMLMTSRGWEEALLLPRGDLPMVGIDCCALEALHS
jgi:hypothetical protein